MSASLSLCLFAVFAGVEQPNGLDTIDSRFCRLRDSARNFNVLQYGIATFKLNTDTNTYVCSPGILARMVVFRLLNAPVLCGGCFCVCLLFPARTLCLGGASSACTRFCSPNTLCFVCVCVLVFVGVSKVDERRPRPTCSPVCPRCAPPCVPLRAPATVSGRFDARPYSFHIYPTTDFAGEEPTFLVQASSLRFLARNHFDFNKTVYHGVPYLSNQQEQRILKARAARKAAQAARPRQPIALEKVRADDRQWLDMLQREVTVWMDTKAKPQVEAAAAKGGAGTGAGAAASNGVAAATATATATGGDEAKADSGDEGVHRAKDEEVFDVDALPHMVLPPMNRFK